MERVDVLERVKGLLLLPNTEYATSAQVAEFYEVSEDVIRMLVMNNKDEISLDGYIISTGKEIKKLVSKEDLRTNIINKRGYFLVETENGFVKMANRSNGLFPRREILRVGMLLRDSEVAKEVRTQLLNIEEKASDEVKTADLNEEILLKIAVADAYSSGYMHRK